VPSGSDDVFRRDGVARGEVDVAVLQVPMVACLRRLLLWTSFDRRKIDVGLTCVHLLDEVPRLAAVIVQPVGLVIIPTEFLPCLTYGIVEEIHPNH
jgi:hypothetical protein